MRKFPETYISPSKIDDYISYKNGYTYSDVEYPTSEYVDNLLGIRKPSDWHKANCGSACHLALETMRTNELSKLDIEYQNNTYHLDFELESEIYLPKLKEQWIKKSIAGYEIIGKVDAIDSLTVYDHKFSGNIDMEKFIDCYQWRLYLLMTGRKRFTYNLFHVDNSHGFDVKIKDFQQLKMVAYPRMQKDCENIVREMADFLIKIKSLLLERIDNYNSEIDNQISIFKQLNIVDYLPTSEIITNNYIGELLKLKIKLKE